MLYVESFAYLYHIKSFTLFVNTNNKFVKLITLKDLSSTASISPFA